jgi:hypothetical protein
MALQFWKYTKIVFSRWKRADVMNDFMENVSYFCVMGRQQIVHQEEYTEVTGCTCVANICSEEQKMREN